MLVTSVRKTLQKAPNGSVALALHLHTPSEKCCTLVSGYVNSLNKEESKEQKIERTSQSKLYSLFPHALK